MYSPASAALNLGAFATKNALQATFPAATNLGNFASVGSAPYLLHRSDGVDWVDISSVSTTSLPAGALPLGVTTTAAQISDASIVGKQLLTTTTAEAARGYLGLGTASTFASTAFATAAQGTKADTALQLASLTSELGTRSVSSFIDVEVSQPVIGQVLKWSGTAFTNQDDAISAGGVGSTNLTYTASATNGIVSSDTGTDATLTLVDANNAGLMSPSQDAKLSGIAVNATANSSDATLLNRANHTGTQLAATISNFNTQASAAAPVQSVSGRTGDITLTAVDVGLSNVNNTSDADKPVSTAQATAISLKYTLPVTGIPPTALAEAVQTSLTKADSALQPGALPVGTTLPADQVSDATVVGKGLLTSANAAAARTLLQLGTASLLNANVIVQAVNGIAPDGNGNVLSRTFTAGVVGATAVVLSLADYSLVGAPNVLTVTPDTGVTILIESSTNGGSTYTAMGSITVTDSYQYILQPGETAVTHIRMTRTAGSSIISTYALSGGIDYAQYPAGTSVGSVNSITDASTLGKQLLTAATATAAQGYLGLGTAATSASTAFATAAQGTLAGTAVQPAALSAAILSVTPEVNTWGDLTAMASPVVGRVYTVLQPIVTGGAYGTRWAWDGTFFRPAAHQVLWNLITQVDGISGGSVAEQVFSALTLPAGLLRGVRLLQLRSRFIWSAADTNGRNLAWKLGTTGTASDVNLSTAFPGNTSRQYRYPTAVVPVSATTVRHASGDGGVGISLDIGANSTVAPTADATVGNMAGVMYLQLTGTQGVSPTSTMSVPWASVYVE